MATSALIAYMNTAGEIFSINTCSDGYLSWTGQKLHNSFNSYELAEQLVLPGDIYQLADSLEDTRRMQDRVLFKFKYSSLDDFLADKGSYGNKQGVYLNGFSHVYLFMDNTWYYHNDNQLHLLKDFVNVVEPALTISDKLSAWVWVLRMKIARVIAGV